MSTDAVETNKATVQRLFDAFRAGDTDAFDKLIVEELSDPLMHIIRNAIDHGIELPKDRELAGKPTVGTLALNAFQKGNHVLIEVEDDGAGMDDARLIETALRRGLIDEPAKLSGGHRRYQPTVLRRIAFIRRAQALGFSLAEIAILLKYSDGTNWKETRQIAEKKVESLNIHIEQLRKICSELNALIEESKAGKGKGTCPIIKSISGPES